jgi:hypothetical protein
MSSFFCTSPCTFSLCAAQHVAQRALVHRDGDVLAGARDDFDQQPQLGRDATVLALLLDQVLREADAFHDASRARVTTSRTSLLRSGLAATRAMASRAALR